MSRQGPRVGAWGQRSRGLSVSGLRTGLASCSGHRAGGGQLLPSGLGDQVKVAAGGEESRPCRGRSAARSCPSMARRPPRLPHTSPSSPSMALPPGCAPEPSVAPTVTQTRSQPRRCPWVLDTLSPPAPSLTLPCLQGAFLVPLGESEAVSPRVLRGRLPALELRYLYPLPSGAARCQLRFWAWRQA